MSEINVNDNVLVLLKNMQKHSMYKNTISEDEGTYLPKYLLTTAEVTRKVTTKDEFTRGDKKEVKKTEK